MSEKSRLEDVVQRLVALESQILNLEHLIVILIKRTAKSKTERLYVSLREGGEMLGIKPETLRKWLWREGQKDGGLDIRRLRGKIHVRDFVLFLEKERERRPSRKQQIEGAVKRLIA